MNPELTIIIINWNTCEYLKRCLLSLERIQEKDLFQVTVVDNHSSDDTIELIKSKFPDVILIENKENMGFAKANNIAIENTNTRYVMLLNPDTVVLDGSIKILYEFMENNQNSGICGPRLLNEDGTFQRSVINFPTFFYEFMYHAKYHFFPFSLIIPNMGPINYKKIIEKQSKVNKAIKVAVVPGCSMFLRKKLIDDIGMLSEDYFLFSEENDICYRANIKNWNVNYIPDAQILHYGGKSFNKKSSFEKTFYFYESRFKFFEKYKSKIFLLFLRSMTIFFFAYCIFFLYTKLIFSDNKKVFQAIADYKKLLRIYI